MKDKTPRVTRMDSVHGLVMECTYLSRDDYTLILLNRLFRFEQFMEDNKISDLDELQEIVDRYKKCTPK